MLLVWLIIKKLGKWLNYIFIIFCVISGDMFFVYIFLSVVVDKDIILIILFFIFEICDFYYNKFNNYNKINK